MEQTSVNPFYSRKKQGKHILSCLISFFFFSIFVFGVPVLAAEIAYLPANVLGEVPSALGTKEEASLEMAQLSRHYLKLEYFTEVLSPKAMGVVETDKILTDSILSAYCLDWDVQFIAQDFFDFGSPVLVQTDLFHCKTRTRQKIQSQLKTNFVLSLARHIEKTFRFLPPMETLERANPNPTIELNFLFDMNGAYAFYKKDLVRIVQGFIDSPNLLLGMYACRKDKIVKIPSRSEHEEVKRFLEEIQWSGSNTAETILQTLNTLIANAKSNTKSEKKNFLLFSSAVKDKETAIIQALNQLRHLGYQNTLLITNQSDLGVLRSLQRIAKGSNSKVYSITDYQTVFSTDSTYTIYLNEGKLYSSRNPEIPPFSFGSSIFQKYDPGLVRSVAEDLSPYSMAEAFERVIDKRIIEKKEIQTDLESWFQMELEKRTSESKNYNTVLLKTKGESIWIRVPSTEKFVEGKEVLVLTEFALDPLSSYGIQNHPGKTKILKANSPYPKLLGVMPSQAKKFIESNSIQRFHGYILGTIIASKAKTIE